MTQDEDHEALCRRCGRCCYEKLIIDDCVFTTRKPCPHLDTKSNTCVIYARRHKLNPRCLSVEEGIRYGVFPADCPYIQNLPDYRPAEEGWLDDEVVTLIERGQIFHADDIRAEIILRSARPGKMLP